MEIIETAVETTEVTADQQDAFMDGFGADDTAPEVETSADQQDEAEENAQTEETDNEGSEAGADADGEQTQQEQSETLDTAKQDKPAEKQNTPPASWTIKHMGEEKTLAVSDITPEILQKGLDYDRIRGKYDEAKPVMEMFSEFAKSAGMSVADYAKYIRTEAKKAAGMSEAEAKRTVELEEREAAVAAKEAQKQEVSSNNDERRARIKADLAEFSKAFPEIYQQAKTNPKLIPDSVWKDVHGGLSLTAAYSRYAVAQANATAKTASEKAAAAAQEQKNSSRSTGSMRSAGNDKKNSDAFLDGFGS